MTQRKRIYYNAEQRALNWCLWLNQEDKSAYTIIKNTIITLWQTT